METGVAGPPVVKLLCTKDFIIPGGVGGSLFVLVDNIFVTLADFSALLLVALDSTILTGAFPFCTGLWGVVCWEAMMLGYAVTSFQGEDVIFKSCGSETVAFTTIGLAALPRKSPIAKVVLLYD